MTWWEAAFLAAAGVIGGLTGSIAGLASVATYPALLVVGLPPVTANMTNTVAMVFIAVDSVWGSRPELKGQGPWLRRILPVAALAGAIGAVLLLFTPTEGFEKIVPTLLGGASIAIAVPRGRERAARVASHRRHATTILLESAAIFLICVYGGYFGAAAGVLLIALLLHVGRATLAHANASKNIILGVSNTVAADLLVRAVRVLAGGSRARTRLPGRCQTGSGGGPPRTGGPAEGTDQRRRVGAGRQARD
jgi:uncharacterized membrane protein YfcA